MRVATPSRQLENMNALRERGEAEPRRALVSLSNACPGIRPAGTPIAVWPLARDTTSVELPQETRHAGRRPSSTARRADAQAVEMLGHRAQQRGAFRAGILDQLAQLLGTFFAGAQPHRT